MDYQPGDFLRVCEKLYVSMNIRTVKGKDLERLAAAAGVVRPWWAFGPLRWLWRTGVRYAVKMTMRDRFHSGARKGSP